MSCAWGSKEMNVESLDQECQVTEVSVRLVVTVEVTGPENEHTWERILMSIIHNYSFQRKF